MDLAGPYYLLSCRQTQILLFRSQARLGTERGHGKIGEQLAAERRGQLRGDLQTCSLFAF
jgi:hypothetical protein